MNIVIYDNDGIISAELLKGKNFKTTYIYNFSDLDNFLGRVILIVLAPSIKLDDLRLLEKNLNNNFPVFVNTGEFSNELFDLFGRLLFSFIVSSNLTDLNALLIQMVNNCEKFRLLKHNYDTVKETSLDNERKVKSLHFMTLMDPLTGLYNYKYLMRYLDGEIKRSERYKHIFSLMLVKIENLEYINETYGFQTGDRLLQEIGVAFMERLTSAMPILRLSDIATRFGGNKIAILLPETSAEGSSIVAERVKRTLSSIEIAVDENTIIKPTLLIGVVDNSNLSKDKKEILNAALNSLKKASEVNKDTLSKN